jgi:Carboxypeptidase regulatory-like domain
MRFPHVVLLSACALMWTATLLAQSPNGVINGLVVDPSNKVIAGADILVMNDVTGVKYFGKTNHDGIYIVPNLPPGPYRLQVSKVGFKTLIKPDIVLNIQDALSINFTLPIGAVFEVVTVEGGAPLVNTESAAVSTVIDQTYVKNMPLNGRSFQDLILLTPGIVTQTPQASGLGNTGLGLTGEFSVNGQRTESNYYTVDGVSANVGAAAGEPATFGAGLSGSIAASTALGTTQALVSVDDLQEFRVQSSTYSAEYGRNPGGQFAFETKSGTNQFHGTIYDYLRNGIFDANDWFNDYFSVTQPNLRQNDFGGTLGGPVQIPGFYNGKDRTFFFVSYEGLQLAAPQAATVNFVPDLCLRGQAAICTGSNSAAPAELQPALKAFPLPTPGGLDFGNGIGQYVASWTNPASLNSTSVRFDHFFNDKLKLFFRFSDTGSTASTRGNVVNSGTPSMYEPLTYALRTYTLGASSILSGHLSNDFRLNRTTNGTTSSVVLDDFGGATPVDLSQITGLGPGSLTEVILLYAGASGAYLYQQQASGGQSQWNVVDTLSVALGHHQFKFGVDYRRLAPHATVPTPSATYFYSDQSAVITNSPSALVDSFAPAYPLYTNFSAFGTDEWRLSPHLNLSLGLRWEVNPAPGVTRGLQPYTVQGTSPDAWSLAPQGTPLWRTTWYNFAPRVGVAYTVRDRQGWETVVRSGGGVFFDTGQQAGSWGFNGPGFIASTGFQSGQFPVIPAVPSVENPPNPPYDEVFGFEPHLQLPYTLQWNLSAEQALGGAQTLSVSYVGSHAARLLQENVFVPNNPNIQAVTFFENGLTSDYGSLQTQFRRKLSRGITALASYTWSHCLDYGSENFNLGYQRGSCDFDVRHNFSAAFSYDLPSVVHIGFASALNHWGLDDRFTARTAFPVTLVGNLLPQPNGRLFDGGLSFVPGQPVYLSGENCAAVFQGLGYLSPGQGCPGGRAINPNAFTPIDSGLGNTPRNFARLFGAWQMDLAVRRDFPIGEAWKLQFRAETFNIFNHPNFGTISSNCLGTPGVPGCTNPQFGQATATLANSLGVLSPLYQMGGPRSMQFALKFIF